MAKSKTPKDFSAKRWVTTILQDYKPCNVFNVDETGLYWRAIPDGTLWFKRPVHDITQPEPLFVVLLFTTSLIAHAKETHRGT